MAQNADMMHASFEHIKEALAKAPLLCYPDPDPTRPFHLAVDGSQVAVGAVLYQPTHRQIEMGDDALTPENIVSIHSRALSKHELGYYNKPFKLES